ncbi:MAG: hypothetical protein HQM14_04155 [SAR324 cluster bacterium]|nr:hypothetical protein [SAR324 cluster bacterium]
MTFRRLLKKRWLAKPLQLLLILSIWVMLGGWDWLWNWGHDRSRDIKLNHQIHIDKKQLECIDCHDTADEEDKAGFIKEKTCGECHQEVKATSVNKQECLLCHNTTINELPFRGEKEFKVQQGPKPYKDLLFSHRVHVDKEIDCLTCHNDINKDSNLELPHDKYMQPAEDCIECHHKDLVSNDCTVCHKSMTSNKRPDSHQGDWKQSHGLMANLNFNTEHRDDCMTCHVQNDCTSCHQEQQPRDHTYFWKTQGHGLMADVESERCSTCHQENFCISCHNETAPKSHIGNWGTRHCVNCHLDTSFGPENNNCAVCHRKVMHYLK